MENPKFMAKIRRTFIVKFEEFIKEEGHESIESFVNNWISKGETFLTLYQWLLAKGFNLNNPHNVYAKLRPYLTVPYDAPSAFWNKWNNIAQSKGFENIDSLMIEYRKKYTNKEIARELAVTDRTIEYLQLRLDNNRGIPLAESLRLKKQSPEKILSQRDEDGFVKTDVKEKWIKLLNEKGFNGLREAANFYIENKMSPESMAKELGVTEKALRIRLEKAGILIPKEEIVKNAEDSLGLL